MSASMMETLVSAVFLADTPAGRVFPKVSFTLSPSSLSLSEAAVKVKVTVCSVSPGANSTLAGTPE